MDREQILKESRETLAAGQLYLVGLQKLRAYDESIAEEIEALIENGDEEFAALNDEFMTLLEALEE